MITFVIISARPTRPYPLRPDLAVFDPVLRTLAAQESPPNFEVILVDAHHAERPDLLAGERFPFPVSHIPAPPNPWHALGRSACSAQLNEGIIRSRGEFLFFGCEAMMFPPEFSKKLAAEFNAGNIPVAWYTTDYSLLNDVASEHTGSDDPANISSVRYALTPAPLPYDLLGHDGRSVVLDHRAATALTAPPGTSCHWQWYYLYSGLPTDIALEINGFDERMDGDISAVDYDMGSRIEMAGHADRLRMQSDLFVAEVPAQRWEAAPWSMEISRPAGTPRAAKCNHALYAYSRLTHTPSALAPLSPDQINDLRMRVCADGGCCGHMKDCRNVAHLRPFGLGEAVDPELFAIWRSHRPRNLREEHARIR